MSFLTWNNQADADASLAAVNAVYGCPYTNGSYSIDTWDVVAKSDAENKWGFIYPEARLGKTVEELEAALVAGYTEHQNRPNGWVATEEN